MSFRKAELLLATVIIARATSLPIIKGCLGEFETLNLMALRFGIALICMLPFIWRKLHEISLGTILRGGILGLLFYIIIIIELQGLRMTNSASIVAFLENTAIVMVPLFEALLHKRSPHRQNLFCALLALAGVGFLLLNGGRLALSLGAIICMISAILYSCYIIATDRISHKDDPLLIGTVAIGVTAVLAGVTTFIFETPRLPAGGLEWFGIIMLAVVCSSIGTALQPVAQRYVPSEKACIFCALNPLSTCIMGWLFLSEWQGVTGIIGAVLILSAIVLSQMPEKTSTHI